MAWIDVSGNILLQGLVEAFGEAICLKDQLFLWTEGYRVGGGLEKLVGQEVSRQPKVRGKRWMLGRGGLVPRFSTNM